MWDVGPVEVVNVIDQHNKSFPLRIRLFVMRYSPRFALPSHRVPSSGYYRLLSTRQQEKHDGLKPKGRNERFNRALRACVQPGYCR